MTKIYRGWPGAGREVGPELVTRLARSWSRGWPGAGCEVGPELVARLARSWSRGWPGAGRCLSIDLSESPNKLSNYVLLVIIFKMTINSENNLFET